MEHLPFAASTLCCAPFFRPVPLPSRSYDQSRPRLPRLRQKPHRLAVAGVPSAALWGVIAGIGSLLPTVGTALVSIPAVIFLVATGHVPQAIGMGIWAFMIVGWVDNLLNPIVISSKIKIPQILVLFSVLGGLAFMGPVGFLFGPLIVSLLYALITIYRDEYEDKKEELPV